MPVFNATYIKQYGTTTTAVDFTTTNLGGPINALNEITGATKNELFFSMDALMAGMGSLIQNAKSHLKNTHPDTPAQQVKVWMENGGIPLPATAQPSFFSTSALDNATKKLIFLGYLYNGDSLASHKNMNGTTSTFCNDMMSALHRVEVVNVADGDPDVASGDIYIFLGETLIGIIRAGLSCLTCEVKMTFTTSQNESGTNGPGNNASVAPASGIVGYTRPVSEATAIIIPGGNLNSNSDCGCWHQLEVAERAQSSNDIEVSLAIQVRS